MNDENKNDLIILYSGGADSRLLLELAIATGKTPYCVLINYEQLHINELKYAKDQLTERGIEYQTVSIKNLNINSGLTGDGIKNDSGLVHEMHVPSRNLMFIGVAASIAESKNIDLIWSGADYSDYLNKFPDCMPDWITKVNNVLQINGPKPIRYEAPLIGFTKDLVLATVKAFGINEEDIYSGYGGL